MKKINVYVVAETPSQAMAQAERGHFVREAEKHTIVKGLKDRTWKVVLEVNAVECYSAKEKKEA